MRCGKVERNLSAYVDRELDLPAARKLEAHLSGCPRCRERLDALARVETALGDFPAREPSPFLWTRVQAGLGGREEPAFRPASARLRHPVRVAAAVCLILAAVLGGAVFSLRPGGVRTASGPEAAGLEIAVAENLDLLENYELIMNLDLMENWEGKS